MKITIGSILKKRYKVEESLGRGGMAEVYKVWDEQRQSYLAAKVLRDDLAHDVVFLKRFEREARTLTRLQHANIVRSYGLVQDNMLVFMLMDYIDGDSLRELIFKSRGKGMDSAAILEIMRPVCSALHYAHSQGIIHCDLKPGNILIDSAGKVFVSDFGIARNLDSATATMVGIGTPAYMAPELIKGLDPTPQTDIYALGIVLYEMATGGERPFTGETAAITGTTAEKVRWEQLNIPPIPPSQFDPDIPPAIEKAILHCLEKDSRKRFDNTINLLDSITTESNRKSDHSTNHNYSADGEPKKSKPTIKGNCLKSPWFTAAVIGLFITFVFLAINRNFSKAFFVSSTTTPTIEKPVPTQTPEITVAALEEIEETSTTKLCQLAFVSDRDGNDEIYLMDESGGNINRLTFDKLLDGNPSWSPDGNNIAFESNRDMDGTEIFTIDTTGNNLRQLTFNDRDDFDPKWSPNGNLIVYSSYDGYNFVIYSVNVDGKNERQLTNPSDNCQAPTWSPDGSEIAYMAPAENGVHIFTKDLNGNENRKLTSGNSKNGNPDWCGSQIAFMSNRNNDIFQIYIMDNNGENIRQLTFNDNWKWSPNFSPGCTKIAFFSEIEGNRVIFTINSDGTNLQQLTPANGWYVDPAWSPNCKK